MAIKWWAETFIALAGAIAMKPKVLIVDEPIAQLDPQHAKQIYDVLKTLNEEYGTTIITSSIIQTLLQRIASKWC